MYIKNVEEKHLASIGKARVLCICVFRVSKQLDHKGRILTTERHIQKHRSGPRVLPFEQHLCGGQPLRSPAGCDVSVGRTKVLIFQGTVCRCLESENSEAERGRACRL